MKCETIALSIVRPMGLFVVITHLALCQGSNQPIHIQYQPWAWHTVGTYEV
jgi:hypothetical protein